MKIIYIKKDNSIAVLIPTIQALSFATIDQIAEKDVPKDLPYWIVEDSEIPTDRTDRDLWTFETDLEPNGFGGENNTFDDELLAKYHKQIGVTK